MDAILVHPGSSESHALYVSNSFIPLLLLFIIHFTDGWKINSLLESLTDDLVVEVLDSEGKTFGNVIAQVSTMLEDSVSKLKVSIKLHFFLIVFSGDLHMPTGCPDIIFMSSKTSWFGAWYTVNQIVKLLEDCNYMSLVQTMRKIISWRYTIY